MRITNWLSYDGTYSTLRFAFGACFHYESERISTLRVAFWCRFDCYLGQNNSHMSSHKFNVTILFLGCFYCDLGPNSSYTPNHRFNVTIWFGGCSNCDLEPTNSFTVSHQFNVTIWFRGCFPCFLDKTVFTLSTSISTLLFAFGEFWIQFMTQKANRNVECLFLKNQILFLLKKSVQRYDLRFSCPKQPKTRS